MKVFGGYDLIIPRSKFYKENPLHFVLERPVQFPYLLQCYLKVQKSSKESIEIYPSSQQLHWAQFPDDIQLLKDDTLFEVNQTIDGEEHLKIYTFILNDSLVYQRAKEAVGKKRAYKVFAEVCEFNTETNNRSAVQQTGLLYYPDDGNLFGLD